MTGRAGGSGHKNPRLARDDRDSEVNISRSGSVNSLTNTLASERSGGSSSRAEDSSKYVRPLREMEEAEVREDMIAWRLPSGVAA